MKMIFLALCVLACFAIGEASPPSPTPQEARWDEDHAYKTVGYMMGSIADMEREALGLLAEAKNWQQRPYACYYAIEFLAFIRSTKAIPVLCECLVFEQHIRHLDEQVGPRLKYPASAALARIGTPAVEGLLQKISTSETTVHYRDIALGVIVEICGKDQVFLVLIDYQRRVTKKDDPRWQRLEQLKKEFDEHWWRKGSPAEVTVMLTFKAKKMWAEEEATATAKKGATKY